MNNMNTMRGQTMRMGSNAPASSAHRRLGIRTSDIQTNLFQANGLSNMVTGGKIVRAEFFGFWSLIASQETDDASKFFETLAQQLKELDKQQASGQSTPLSINGIPAASIYNTLAFLICTPSIKLDREKLNAVYNAYADAARDPIRSGDSTAHKNLMRLFTARSHGEITDEAVLSPLIIAASTITPKDMRFNEWLRLPTIDESDIQPNEYGFVYNYLSSLISERSYEVLHPLIKSIYDKAHSLPQQARMALPVAEQTLLCLLHMMRHFLSAQALPNIDFLERGIRIFRQFTMWQQPYGKISEQMVNLLKHEMLNPGYIRRQHVFAESLVVDYGTGQGIPQAYKFSKPVFYLYDVMDTQSLSMLNILDPLPLNQACVQNNPISLQDVTGGQYPPSSVLSQALVHAFEWISPETQFKPDELEQLRVLPQDKLVTFIQRLQALEAKYKHESDQFIYNVMGREQDYLSLKSDVMKDAMALKGPPLFTFACESPQNPPPLPHVEHIRVPVELKAKGSDDSKLGYPAGAMYDKLKQLLEGYQQQNVTPGQKLRELRFALIGNDRLLQHVVAAYYLLSSSYPQYFDGLDVKFYMVPCTKNHLANYLARHDLWYFRHIYTPFRCPYPFLVPWLRDDETEVKQNNETGVLAYSTQFLRDCVAQYAREAHHVYKSTIFKLEGFAEVGQMNAEPTEVIPFLQRVEIGMTPAVEEYKLKNGQAGMKYEEIAKDKNFLYSPPELSIRYSKVDLTGQPKLPVVDDAIPYHSIALSHVPRKNDGCNVPEPHSTGIELCVQPGSKIEKSRLKKNSLYFDPRQHIAEITCISQTPFKVMVDNGLYGPFKQIRVSVATLKSGKIANFPVQTFFPTQ